MKKKTANLRKNNSKMQYHCYVWICKTGFALHVCRIYSIPDLHLKTILLRVENDQNRCTSDDDTEKRHLKNTYSQIWKYIISTYLRLDASIRTNTARRGTKMKIWIGTNQGWKRIHALAKSILNQGLKASHDRFRHKQINFVIESRNERTTRNHVQRELLSKYIFHLQNKGVSLKNNVETHARRLTS